MRGGTEPEDEEKRNTQIRQEGPQKVKQKEKERRKKRETTDRQTESEKI